MTWAGMWKPGELQNPCGSPWLTGGFHADQLSSSQLPRDRRACMPRARAQNDASEALGAPRGYLPSSKPHCSMSLETKVVTRTDLLPAELPASLRWPSQHLPPTSAEDIRPSSTAQSDYLESQRENTSRHSWCPQGREAASWGGCDVEV